MTRSRFSRFGSWLRKQNVIVFSLVLGILCFLFNVTISAPFELGWISDIQWFPTPEEKLDNIIVFAFTAIIVAPILETFLFQMLPMWIFWRWRFFRDHRWMIVLISGLVFGLQHYYSLNYILVTIVMGFIMMYGYIVKYKRHPYFSLLIFHALWNGLVTLLEFLK